MRILFGIMSAVQPASTVGALCDAIGPDFPILIHHDFSQQPSFVMERPNVAFVADPVRTGWGNWGFTEGIQKLVRTAMARDDWDFIQLLSPTCMPIRPLSEFRAYVQSSGVDYLIDGINIASNDCVLMSHGWRAFAPVGQMRHRLLRRARRWYLGNSVDTVNYAGLAFPFRSRLGEPGLAGLKARIGLGLMKAAQRGIGFQHVFSPSYPCHAGSNWFGATRRGCEYLLARTEGTPLLDYFKRIHMPDEMLYPTVFMNSDLKGAAAPHYVSRFTEARPDWITPEDLDEVLDSGRFFARKFPEDVSAPVRVALKSRVDRPPAAVGAQEGTATSGRADGLAAKHLVSG